jgi:hypothetical protein
MATVVTSAVAKIAPTKISAKVMICTGLSHIAEPAEPCSTGLTGGSVERWTMNAAEPKVSSRVLTRMPASGNSATLRPTESEAPEI